jgi:hypothetical protein
MDERAEIWIARDPETQAESKPVSLRKLRKGAQIGRLKPTVLVKRVDASEWITLERFLTDVAMLAAKTEIIEVEPDATGEIEGPAPPKKSEPPKVVVAKSEPPPPDVVVPKAAPLPVIDGQHSPHAKTIPPAPRPLGPDDSQQSVTAQWFMEPPPEPEDEEPFFPPQESLLDVRFERVMSFRLVRLAYVLMLATLAGAVLVSLVRAVAAFTSGDRTEIATSLALVPVVVLACAMVGAFGRMALEVLLALFRIADTLSAIRKTTR